MRTVRKGKLVHLAGTSENGLLKYYRDPLPTNCVADWVCDGYKYPESHNLAVFYESCTLNCLFCQNWHFRKTNPGNREGISADRLAAAADHFTFCVCFFGGDPSSQMLHALSASKQFAEKQIHICWEQIIPDRFCLLAWLWNYACSIPGDVSLAHMGSNLGMNFLS